MRTRRRRPRRGVRCGLPVTGGGRCAAVGSSRRRFRRRRRSDRRCAAAVGRPGVDGAVADRSGDGRAVTGGGRRAAVVGPRCSRAVACGGGGSRVVIDGGRRATVCRPAGGGAVADRIGGGPAVAGGDRHAVGGRPRIGRVVAHWGRACRAVADAGCGGWALAGGRGAVPRAGRDDVRVQATRRAAVAVLPGGRVVGDRHSGVGVPTRAVRSSAGERSSSGSRPEGAEAVGVIAREKPTVASSPGGTGADARRRTGRVGSSSRPAASPAGVTAGPRGSASASCSAVAPPGVDCRSGMRAFPLPMSSPSGHK